MSSERTQRLKEILAETWTPPNTLGMQQDAWPIDGINGEWESYSHTFKNLLQRAGAESLDSLVARFGARGKPVAVLDVMGGGYFLDNPSVADHIFAIRRDEADAALRARYEVRMQDRDPKIVQQGCIYARKLDEYRTLATLGKRRVIVGNVLDEEVWESLDTAMRDSGVSQFQLIACRPQGPFRIPTMQSSGHMDIFIEMYDRMIRRLSPNGLMFAQIPHAIDDKSQMLELKRQLQASHGNIVTHIDVEPPMSAYITYKDPVMMVYKNP